MNTPRLWVEDEEPTDPGRGDEMDFNIINGCDVEALIIPLDVDDDDEDYSDCF